MKEGIPAEMRAGSTRSKQPLTDHILFMLAPKSSSDLLRPIHQRAAGINPNSCSLTKSCEAEKVVKGQQLPKEFRAFWCKEALIKIPIYREKACVHLHHRSRHEVHGKEKQHSQIITRIETKGRAKQKLCLKSVVLQMLTTTDCH